MTTFAEKLQIKIRNTEKTNNEFAKWADIKKKVLDRILKGEKPDRWTIQKLAKALNVDVEEIESWTPREHKKTIVPSKVIIHPAKFKKKVKSPLIAQGRCCIRCFWKEGIHVCNSVEMAHYTGQMQMGLGKGRGTKVSDILKCPLCKKCHNYFDIEIEYKSIKKSEEFLFLISLFLSQEYEAGNIIIKQNGFPDFPCPA